MKKTPLLLVLGLALSPIGNAQTVKVDIVAVESLDDFTRWLGDPVDPARAAAVASYPGRLASIPFGRKTPLPIVVSGLPSPAREMRLSADVEIASAEGRVLGTWPRCCHASMRSRAPATALLLNPAVMVEPEGHRPRGSYTVRVSVTDGTQRWTTSEALPYGTSDLPGTAFEAPRLRMNVPAGEPSGGGPGDKRDCLSLPTPAEVIKCSERK